MPWSTTSRPFSRQAANAEGSRSDVGGPPWIQGEERGGGETRPGRHGGGPPAPSRLFESFDTNDNGELTSDEVPAPVWQRLSSADLNDDGVVTEAEVQNYLQSP